MTAVVWFLLGVLAGLMIAIAIVLWARSVT